jgi:hypothetical protein
MARDWRDENVYNILVRKLKGRNHSEDKDGKITLE